MSLHITSPTTVVNNAKYGENDVQGLKNDRSFRKIELRDTLFCGLIAIKFAPQLSRSLSIPKLKDWTD